MADEITFQNDPVDPSVEFRKQHNHFFVAQRAERIEPDRAAGELLWKRMSLPEGEYADERACPPAGLGDGDSIMLQGYEPGERLYAA